jgi:hypothetical protein
MSVTEVSPPHIMRDDSGEDQPSQSTGFRLDIYVKDEIVKVDGIEISRRNRYLDFQFLYLLAKITIERAKVNSPDTVRIKAKDILQMQQNFFTRPRFEEKNLDYCRQNINRFVREALNKKPRDKEFDLIGVRGNRQGNLKNLSYYLTCTSSNITIHE